MQISRFLYMMFSDQIPNHTELFLVESSPSNEQHPARSSFALYLFSIFTFLLRVSSRRFCNDSALCWAACLRAASVDNWSLSDSNILFVGLEIPWLPWTFWYFCRLPFVVVTPFGFLITNTWNDIDCETVSMVFNFKIWSNFCLMIQNASPSHAFISKYPSESIRILFARIASTWHHSILISLAWEPSTGKILALSVDSNVSFVDKGGRYQNDLWIELIIYLFNIL